MTPAKKIGDLYFMTAAAVHREFDSGGHRAGCGHNLGEADTEHISAGPCPSLRPTCISGETRQCSVYGGHYVISHHGNGRLNWAKNLCLPILCGEKIWREWVELLKGGWRVDGDMVWGGA